jgi:chromatin structure-remodeling complex protein RSC7
MAEAPPVKAATPQEDDEDPAQQEDDDDQNDAEDDATPQDSPRPSRSATPRRGRGQPRGRRRLGRPPKRVTVGSEDDNNEPASDAGTPKRRGGFRGGRGGGRWAKYKAGLSRQTAPPVDDDGNVLDVVDDEVVLPGDPEGDTHVDSNGYLQDGREYRVRTFTILGRGQKLYMLSTEPARCIGFRDSYLFFQKHKYLYKILIDEEEKRDLIERDVMPNSYKGRQIGVVTARSVYREFGAKIVIGGKKITDDYKVQEARERGDVEGELAVPEDRLPAPGEEYNRNQYVAWHGASQVYHTNPPGAPQPGGKGPEGKRKRIVITSDNWMLEHAREASRFNGTLANARKANFDGIYDVHTNAVLYPKDMQSTHGRWEKIDDANPSQDEDLTRRLPQLPPIYARNFRIHDLCLETAPQSAFGEPGDQVNANDLSSIPPHIIEELPEECAIALHEAQQLESVWQSKWTAEKRDGLRTHFLPSVDWYPKQS